MVIRKTHGGKVQNAFMALLGVWGLVMAYIFMEEGGTWIFLAVGLAGFMGLALNAWHGPTCRTHIFTAVQKERLTSLSRIRNVEKVMGRIGPLIEAVQGFA